MTGQKKTTEEETEAVLSDRYRNILSWFKENMPAAGTELDFDSPFHLLIAVILSAQCTDKRVNIVTPPLFERFPTPESMAQSSREEIFSYIKSVSYPNNKAAHLLGMARMLVTDFGSNVPDDTGQLMKLPGVGRKTANVIASIVYDKPVIAVDTHVFRVARRLGLSEGTSVSKVEDDLTANIPQELRGIAHHWLILHGRYTCTAQKPKCESCPLASFCRYMSGKQLIDAQADAASTASAAKSAAGKTAATSE